jgi:hypothetical protein
MMTRTFVLPHTCDDNSIRKITASPRFSSQIDDNVSTFMTDTLVAGRSS